MGIIKILTNLIKKTMENQTINGYCMRCKAKREMTNPEEVIMKNKRNAVKGKCSICGTNMFKILGVKKDIPATTEPTSNPIQNQEQVSDQSPASISEPTSTSEPTPKPTVENEMDSFDEANK